MSDELVIERGSLITASSSATVVTGTGVWIPIAVRRNPERFREIVEAVIEHDKVELAGLEEAERIAAALERGEGEWIGGAALERRLAAIRAT